MEHNGERLLLVLHMHGHVGLPKTKCRNPIAHFCHEVGRTCCDLATVGILYLAFYQTKVEYMMHLFNN